MLHVEENDYVELGYRVAAGLAFEARKNIPAHIQIKARNMASEVNRWTGERYEPRNLAFWGEWE